MTIFNAPREPLPVTPADHVAETIRIAAEHHDSEAYDHEQHAAVFEKQAADSREIAAQHRRQGVGTP